MAERSNHYRDELDAKRILQIREFTRGLPQACSDFLRSIAVSTSSLTRLAYAIDLNTFFSFLHEERIEFSQKPLTLMNDSDLEKLTRNDIIAYTEYLTYYLKNAEDGSVPNKVMVNHELSIKRKLCTVRSFYDYLFKNQPPHSSRNSRRSPRAVIMRSCPCSSVPGSASANASG